MIEEIPEEWVEKLFNCLEEFYKERFTSLFTQKHDKTFYKAIWKSGLVGLTYDEIKSALVLYKRAAKDLSASPPHIFEFFKCAKGICIPRIDYRADIEKPNHEIARRALDEMKARVGKPPI